MQLLNAEALTTVLTGVVLPSVLVVFLTFIPSIVEWKRPHDAGPRLIPGFYKTIVITQKSTLLDLDTEIGTPLIPQGLSFPAFIGDLEAAIT